MTFKPLISETAPKDHKSIVEAYLKDINYWMNINKLKLNGKTELLNLIQSTHYTCRVLGVEYFCWVSCCAQRPNGSGFSMNAS